MRIDTSREGWLKVSKSFRFVFGITGVLLFATAYDGMAETLVSGQSDTILRIGEYTEHELQVPAYEYFRLGIRTTDNKGGVLSANFGGWGRFSLDDRSSKDGHTTDSDMQYGYISYQAPKGNMIATAGRQYVTEGVAAERLDGIYLRSDIAAGFAASAFAGNPVLTEPNYKGGDVLYGGRLSHTNSKYYTVGVSALRSEGDNSDDREELGFDMWIHPIKQLDLAGRSSYNSEASDWMEHAYTVSLIPSEMIRISADVTNINYKEYFSDSTTSVFKFNPTIIDPDEEMTSYGIAVSVTPIKSVTITPAYKYYEYDIAKSANNYGLRISYANAESYSAGASVYRMDGDQDRLQYTEYRMYASKQFKKADLALDLMNTSYDEEVNGRDYAYTIVAAAGYLLDKNLKLGGSIDYSRNPDYDAEVRGLVKLTYAFDMKYADEGRAK